jgi:hypothetical protein
VVGVLAARVAEVNGMVTPVGRARVGLVRIGWRAAIFLA